MTTGHTGSVHGADLTHANWTKTTRSDQQHACVEVAIVDATTYVRDTKQAGAGPVLAFTPAEWDASRPVADGIALSAALAAR